MESENQSRAVIEREKYGKSEAKTSKASSSSAVHAEGSEPLALVEDKKDEEESFVVDVDAFPEESLSSRAEQVAGLFQVQQKNEPGSVSNKNKRKRVHSQ